MWVLILCTRLVYSYQGSTGGGITAIDVLDAALPSERGRVRRNWGCLYGPKRTSLGMLVPNS